tara:strand:+ start:281 stop:592 length:312 start_codon:yes stop_codon:yes gene_type:complete
MTTNHDHNTPMDALDEALLEEKSYRACIDQLIGTASLNKDSNVDSKKMYARVLLECLLAEDVTLEEIFHPTYTKYAYYEYSPLKMKKVLMKEKLEKDLLLDED